MPAKSGRNHPMKSVWSPVVPGHQGSGDLAPLVRLPSAETLTIHARNKFPLESISTATEGGASSAPGRPLTASGAIDVDDCQCDSAEVLGIVASRESAAVSGCQASPSPAWRNRIQVLTITPSAPFKKTILQQPANTKISVDPFHLVQLTSLMLTRVRQRLVRKREQRRGREIDLACTPHCRGPLESRQSTPCGGTSGFRQNAQEFRAQLQWRASSILRTFAALSGQVAKPGHLPVADRSSAPLHRFRHRQGFVDDHRLQGGASALLGRGNRGVSFTERG